MNEPSTEAYAAAAQAIHDRECADGGACQAEPMAMHRYAELGQRVVDAVWPIAVATIRAEIAAEIRAESARLEDMSPMPIQAMAFDHAARIAEGGVQ